MRGLGRESPSPPPQKKASRSSARSAGVGEARPPAPRACRSDGESTCGWTLCWASPDPGVLFIYFHLNRDTENIRVAGVLQKCWWVAAEPSLFAGSLHMHFPSCGYRSPWAQLGWVAPGSCGRPAAAGIAGSPPGVLAHTQAFMSSLRYKYVLQEHTREIKTGKNVILIDVYIEGKLSSSLPKYKIFSIVILWMPFSWQWISCFADLKSYFYILACNSGLHCVDKILFSVISLQIRTCVSTHFPGTFLLYKLRNVTVGLIFWR